MLQYRHIDKDTGIQNQTMHFRCLQGFRSGNVDRLITEIINRNNDTSGSSRRVFNSAQFVTVSRIAGCRGDDIIENINLLAPPDSSSR